MEGNLSETPFDQLLLKLWKEHATGILKITSREDDTETVERRFNQKAERVYRYYQTALRRLGAGP